jgi:hypothetical protein
MLREKPLLLLIHSALGNKNGTSARIIHKRCIWGKMGLTKESYDATIIDILECQVGIYAWLVSSMRKQEVTP